MITNHLAPYCVVEPLVQLHFQLIIGEADLLIRVDDDAEKAKK